MVGGKEGSDYMWSGRRCKCRGVYGLTEDGGEGQEALSVVGVGKSGLVEGWLRGVGGEGDGRKASV